MDRAGIFLEIHCVDINRDLNTIYVLGVSVIVG